MRVYELMQKLSVCEAGAEVSGNLPNTECGYLLTVQDDGDSVSLSFDDAQLLDDVGNCMGFVSEAHELINGEDETDE